MTRTGESSRSYFPFREKRSTLPKLLVENQKPIPKHVGQGMIVRSSNSAFLNKATNTDLTAAAPDSGATDRHDEKGHTDQETLLWCSGTRKLDHKAEFSIDFGKPILIHTMILKFRAGQVPKGISLSAFTNKDLYGPPCRLSMKRFELKKHQTEYHFEWCNLTMAPVQFWHVALIPHPWRPSRPNERPPPFLVDEMALQEAYFFHTPTSRRNPEANRPLGILDKLDMETLFSENMSEQIDAHKGELRRLCKLHGIEYDFADDVYNVFQRYDNSGDGELDQAEWDVFLRAYGGKDAQEMLDTEVNKYWGEIDRDGSGTISFEELLLWARVQQQRGGFTMGSVYAYVGGNNIEHLHSRGDAPARVNVKRTSRRQRSQFVDDIVPTEVATT